MHVPCFVIQHKVFLSRFAIIALRTREVVALL